AGAARNGGGGAAGSKGKRPAAGQGQAARNGQPRNGQPRRKNEGRRIDEPVVTRQEMAKPREKQPVIIHKESKIDRLPSLEQLEQLPSRPRGEKPALLTRNREA
ncbi:MAG TPA: DEAD/DEAH box helicase, partial [Pseudomonas sp.]|nr:DEAD/DEAH box helicase [Pseudomonas sp.]HBB21539.1 DEAD/DEAH box helicase [Pseudomonas sp.]